MAFDTPGRTERFLSKPSRSAGIDTSLVGSPQAHDNAPLPPTGGAEGDARCRVVATRGLATERAPLQDQQAEGGARDRTAGMQQAAVPDVHAACRENVREAPAEKRHDVEGGGAWACTARLTGGADDGVVFASHKTSIGDDDPEDRRGEGCAGGVAMAPRLRVDGPGEAPALWGARLRSSGVAHVVFAKGTGDGRERCDGDAAVVSGGLPGRAVLRASTPRADGVAVRVVWELSAPGMQAPGATREGCPDKTLICGAAFERESGGVAQGLGGEAWRRAATGAEGGRDGAGEEAVGTWELCVQGVRKPRRGCMLRALWTVAVATGRMDAVVFSTAWAVREAMSIVPAWALLESTDALAVCGGQMGGALQGCWGKGGEEVTEGGHGRRPCLRELRRV